jgi:histidyl-tRNA synthetase
MLSGMPPSRPSAPPLEPELTTTLDDDMRSRGMRDLGPEAMRRFRAVERVFLDTVAARGYQEIRTPTIEPLHLFTATAALSPALLDRVYSFLDWDGWSGDRVVLRPDATVPAARWYEQHWRDSSEAARLCYVQPVYRFVPGNGEREQWQCGVELFGLPAPAADAELLLLARNLFTALGLRDLRFELAHAGLVRATLAAAGLDASAQAEALERLLANGGGSSDGLAALDRLVAEQPALAPALRLLFAVDGGGGAYIENLRAALLPGVPAAAAALDDLAAAARALDAGGSAYRVLPGTARNFEYYTGLTFRVFAGDAECAGGGRYDGLSEAIGGRAVPASGFGADLLRLADLVSAAQ